MTDSQHSTGVPQSVFHYALTKKRSDVNNLCRDLSVKADC